MIIDNYWILVCLCFYVVFVDCSWRSLSVVFFFFFFFFKQKTAYEIRLSLVGSECV